MHPRIEFILTHKRQSIAQLKSVAAENNDFRPSRVEHMEHQCQMRFHDALVTPSFAVIAEIKRCSPSKGSLARIDDPIALADDYINGGASAISILTEEHVFSGHLNDLTDVVAAYPNMPVLRKDFILDEIQLIEARLAGASAVLLMVSILGEKTASLIAAAKLMGLETLVEVHNERELEVALHGHASIIGVNNRDFLTLEVDTERAFSLIEKIPKTIVTVAESGILNPRLARQYRAAGYNAVLIGEALVRSHEPSTFIKACLE